MVGLVLLDANVLARSVYQPDPQYRTIYDALERLEDLGAKVAYTPQALRETYHFYTRPKRSNGFELARGEALELLGFIDEGSLTLLDDTPGVCREWRSILTTTHVLGAQAHDAHHAAAVRAHGAAGFLTLDRRDFDRYAGVRVLRPDEVLGRGFSLEP